MGTRPVMALTWKRHLRRPCAWDWAPLHRHRWERSGASRVPVRFHCAGFTLLEMVIAIMVMGIIAMLGGQILSGGVNAYQTTESALTTLGKAGYALERMAREIREMQYSGGSYAIVTPLTSDRLRFTKRDAIAVDIQSAPPNITLGYSTPAVSAMLTDQTSAFSFSYYRDDGTTAASGAADVAYVDIQLTLADGGASYTRRTRVGLRNKP